MNSYASLADFKGALIGNVSITTHDTRLRQLIEAVSRIVDQYCRRHFHSLTETRYFSGDGSVSHSLPWDVISVTTLKEDTTGNATYDTTWATTDYVLGPYDAAPTGRAYLPQTAPYYVLEVDQRTTGTKTSIGKGQRRFELVGNFGYSQSSYAAVSLAAEPMDATELGFDVDDGTEFSAGQTILVDSEQMYISSITTNTLTVLRGVNGTTAATHADNAAISIIEYPDPVREAVLLEAGLLLETRGYRRQLGNFETGIITPFGRTFSAETLMKLDPYRKWPV